MHQPLEIAPKQFPQLIIYHYIQDNLYVASDTDTLKKFNEVQKILLQLGLKIAPEKIKRRDFLSYDLN